MSTDRQLRLRHPMPTFEKLTYFLTGIRCEPTISGARLRTVLGILFSSVCGIFAAIFFAAAAGNGNSTSSLIQIFLPGLVLYIAYFTLTCIAYQRGAYQVAQYLAWAPLWLIALLSVFSVVWSL